MEIILDTETTGLEGSDEIVELAIIDAESGDLLFHSKFRPTVTIHPEAERVHGISLDDLATAPTWPDHHDTIVSIIATAERVIIYNAPFDKRLLRQTASAFGLTFPNFTAMDLMVPYAEISQIDYSYYHESWTWQKLSAACYQQSIDISDLSMHGALGDCRATQRLYNRLKIEFHQYPIEKERRRKERCLAQKAEQEAREKRRAYRESVAKKISAVAAATRIPGIEYPYFGQKAPKDGYVVASKVRIRDLDRIEYAGTCCDTYGNHGILFKFK